MTEDNKLGLIIMLGIFLFVATIAGCEVSTNYNNNVAMTKMVAGGADPQDAKCAVKGGSFEICAIRAGIKFK